MRLAKTLISAGALLLAGGAWAHGLHELRGEYRIEDDRLIVALEPGGEHGGDELCLRLLDELHVETLNGHRLAGVETGEPVSKRCRLEYALPPGLSSLDLALRPTRRTVPLNERLVLIPKGDGAAPREALILSNRGGPSRLDLPASR